MEVADKDIKAAIITMLKYIKENISTINKFQQRSILKDENSRTEKYIWNKRIYIWMGLTAEWRWWQQANELEVRWTEIIQSKE